MTDSFNANLRLVGAGDDLWRTGQNARQEVMRENRRAAWSAQNDPALDPTDPRWVLAVRARSQLQGSLLTPERREKLLRLGTQLGLRRFDSNLIIAMVQDEARRSGPMSIPSVAAAAAPGSAAASLASRIGLASDPPTADSTPRTGGRWISAAACALGGTMLLIWWLMGGIG